MGKRRMKRIGGGKHEETNKKTGEHNDTNQSWKIVK
jgi:hypothetical protein